MNINIEELSGAFIDARPIPFDFGSGYGETWEVVYPNVKKWSFAQVEKQLSEFGWTEDLARLNRALERYNADPYAFDTDVNLKAVLNECRERIFDAIIDGDDLTPMMDYLYPIELQDPEEAQSILYRAVIPVVVVHVYMEHEDEWKYYLALSGGGMDLRWEICEAYIRLGYLPPVYFCDLPPIAGRGKSEADQKIIQACLKSIEVNRHHLQWTEQNLKKILEEQTLQNQ
jgi:hypothetical protein